MNLPQFLAVAVTYYQFVIFWKKARQGLGLGLRVMLFSLTPRKRRTSPEFSASIAESKSGVIPAIHCLGSHGRSYSLLVCSLFARGLGRIRPAGLHFPLGLWREEQPGQQELLQDPGCCQL